MLIHLASHTSLSWYWLWHPLSGPGYQFWSGIGSDLSQITLIGLLIGAWRRLNCHAPWCWRLGRHVSADRQHRLCRRHHPDLPEHKLTLEEIHERHATAVRAEVHAEHLNRLGRSLIEVHEKLDQLTKEKP